MLPPSKVISQKICLIGDFSVGKTSLIRQFVDCQFSDKYLSTVGVKISRKLVVIDEDKNTNQQKNQQNNQQLQLVIWDIEGSNRFQGISPSYLQGAKGALIVGDVTRASSIENLKDHISLFQTISPKSSLIIALNKIDLLDQQDQISLFQSITTEFKSLISVYMTSAKTGQGVSQIFQSLAKHILLLK
ncbi:GTP-binding protein [Pseudanabaena biceps]|nr:GTP-binding protein [Pseudanabaena biceps]